MKSIRSFLIGIFFGGGLIGGLHLLYAQESATTVDWRTASDLQVMLQAVELMPTISADTLPRFGTYYSAQNPKWPPLPGNINQVPVWDLGDGVYLLNDQDVDYSLSPLSMRMAGGGMMAADGMSPPGSGGTNIYSPADNTIIPPDYGTNLWIANFAQSPGNATGIISNSFADIEYELQYTTDLLQPWQSAGWFVYGSELTNWTPFNVPAFSPTNFFLRARSWQDDGSGLPLWWQQQYFGTNGVDPYGDPAGDGWNNLQKFQNGMNPTNFYTPPAPQGLAVAFNPSSNVATINWPSSPGPVTGYTVEKTDSYAGTVQDFNGSVASFQDNTSGDIPDPWNGGMLDVSYKIQAHYSGGNSGWSASVPLQQTMATGSIVPGADGTTVLAVSGLSEDATAVRLVYYDWNDSEFNNDFSYNSYVDIPVSDFTNGLVALPTEWQTQGVDSYGFPIEADYVQDVDADGNVSAESLINNNSDGQPFYDGRVQLKQDLIFILRAASGNNPFGFREYNTNYFYPADLGGGSYIYDFGNPPNYVWAGIYQADGDLDGCGSQYFGQYSFGPFDDNYRYRNFVFNTANLGGGGMLTTGVSGYLGEMELVNPLYQFVTVTTNSLLAANQTRWLYLEDTNNFYWGYDTNITTPDGLHFSMAANARNFYGLPYLSAELAYPTSAGLGTTTLYAGGNVTLPSGSSYPPIYLETAQPQFQTVEYDFWNPSPEDCVIPTGMSLVPGMPGFSPTNQSQLIITPVGNPIRLVAYAKLAVTNGYPGVYAYLGQYFDQAYQIDTNGSVTTNTTGVLSPYGNFFATEPGAAALATMPDIDTGQRGTGMVYCVSLNVDANHDGNMDLSFNGPDATSQGSPMVAWVNNGYVGATGDAPVIGGTRPNYSLGYITGQRDLENFFRLWISGMPSLPADQNYAVTLSWQNTSGNPGISLYNSVETNGGIGYLTDTNVALQQSTATNIATGYGSSPYYVGPGVAIAEITNGVTFTFPAGYFTNGSNKYFLFEGAGIGSGELTLTISQNGNTIAQTGVWLDLHDVKDFFEQDVVQDNMSGAKSNWTSYVETVLPAISSGLGNDTNMIVLVHGINVRPWDCVNDAETVCKRLYWAGYQGKFTEVEWPCNLLTPIPSPLSPAVFNDSELQGYKASTALTTCLNGLKTRSPNYRLNILAHSQGNVVVSEAIKNGAPFDTYILTQGALPASAYDVNSTNDPDLLGLSPSPELQPMGYRGIYTNFTGNIVNFYNPLDKVLGWWVTDQIGLKPSVYFSGTTYYYDGTNSYCDPIFTSKYLVADPEESRAEVSRSRTLPIGQIGPESSHGVIQSAVDLNARFGFNGDTFDEHSAQWTRPIQTSEPYYKQILLQIQPTP